jgi:hypothetical protein
MLSDYLCNIKSAPTVTEWERENIVGKLMLFNGVMLPATECQRDPISLVSTTEELLDRKVSAPV